MPLSISDFKNWAAANQRTAVAVGNGALESAANQIGVIDLIFRRGTVDSVRGAAMKEFTRALGARYGVTIAQQALSRAGLSENSELTGKVISDVVGSAKRLRADMLRPVGAKDIRLGEATVARSQFRDLGPDDRKMLTKFLKRRAVAVELLGEFPLSMSDYQDFHLRANDLVARLRRLRDAIIPANIPADEFRAEVDALVRTVERKDAQMRDLLVGQPLGETNMREYRNLMFGAAVKALESLRASAARNPAAAAVIGRVIDQFRNNPRVRQEFEPYAQLSKDAFKNIAPFVAGMVKSRLARANARGFKVEASAVAKLMKAGYRDVLNERPWPVINKIFSAAVGNRPVEIASTILPAEQLGHSEEDPRGPIASRYPQGVHGFMCHSADARNAVNLAVTQLTVKGPDGEPKLAFRGVRHSVHSAWEIGGAQARAEANARRAEEAVMAAFLAKYDVPRDPAELPDPGNDGTVEVDLDIASVALLTPDRMRNYWKAGSSIDERSMLLEQTAAWDTVVQRGVTFQFRGRQVRVKPHILTFNVGVNEGAVKMSGIAPNKAGGWDASDRMNKRAFEALARDVSVFLNDKSKDGNLRAAVLALYTQCHNILILRRERSDGHDAYKLAARLAVLSQLIGRMPCFNCKSGKDRTGEMDVECKFLAVLIARGEKIPDPGAELTPEQKGLFRAIALQGGNFEVQKMNVGVAGFKSGNVASIGERLGGKAYHAFHRGGSDHVA